MKKYFLLLAVFLYAFRASAQMLDVSNYVTSVQMSKEFLKKLSQCTPYEEKKSAGLVNIETSVIYKIVGKKSDGSCEVHIMSDAKDMNITASQICNFSRENLNKFVPAMLNVLKRTSYTLDNLPEMMNDENNLTVMEIMMDEKVCHIHRDAIDMTAKVREKLVNCQPYSETQKLGPIEITRHIVGKSGNLCSLNIRVLQKKPNFENLSGEMVDKMKELVKDIPEEQHYDIKCKLTSEQTMIYKKILEDQIIPAVNGMDDLNNGFGQSNPRAETDFLNNNCDTDFQ